VYTPDSIDCFLPRAHRAERSSRFRTGWRIALVLAVFPTAAWAQVQAPVIEAPTKTALRHENPVSVKGTAASGAEVAIEARDKAGRVLSQWDVQADDAGAFVFELDRTELPDGRWISLRAQSDETWSEDTPFFVHPVIDETATLPMVSASGRELFLEGKPWGFAGLNYTQFLIEFSVRNNQNFERMVEEVRTQTEWGVRVFRVPLHLGMIQPAPGVFPDDPRYTEVLESHGVLTDFYELLEYFIAVSGHYGARVVLEWHEMPTDPYRYFVGGNFRDKGTGRPGTGIAWLANQETGEVAGPGDPAFTKAIVDTNRWLARRFRGNGNLLGFEAPYNEPHSVEDSSDTAWRHLASATSMAVIREDPERLVFGMAPAWGHNNVLASVTWRLPDTMTGVSPHYYLGNGPVAAREDAPQRKEPWLARDVAATFDHSFAAVAMPHSGAPYPVWNGESGEHGYSSFLPDMDRLEASSYMVEAQLVQAYAAGMVGSLGWTLTGHPDVYEPMKDIYRKMYQRFSPVFEAGPVDYKRAEVLFVQNPGAVPINNGLNHACVPFARLALDLHLAPVHYMTDDQLLANGLVQISAGLEQVEEVAATLSYRAAVIDTRNIDSRALDLLENSGIPLLEVDDADRLSADQLAAFLKKAGLDLDRKTAPEMQLIAGREHLLVYRRSGESKGAQKVYPRLHVEGRFSLVNEDGKTVFTGTAQKLAKDGLRVTLPKWRTAIFKIEQK